jgi:hypothetical protein
MHITEIETKDGERFSGPICELNYKEQFISLATSNSRNIKFSEIKSAKVLGQRISINNIGDQDLLEKIRYELEIYYHKSLDEIKEILGE